MTSPPDAVFLRGLDFFTDAVTRLGGSDWERPSPCAGWRALDVLGHVGVGVGFGTRLLLGEQPDWTPVDPPGAAVEGEPSAWWAGLTEPARAAVRDVDLERVIDSPVGPRSVGEGLRFPALDLFIHSWDLSRSIGGDVVFPEDVIEFAHAAIDPLPAERVRSPRVFAPELAPPQAATPTQACLCWSGRDPLWTP